MAAMEPGMARVSWRSASALEAACRLRDTRGCSVSLQVQMEINRFCANSSLVYFLRTMGPAVTRRAALVHDALIEEAFHRIVGTGWASRGERRRAAEQAQLPVGRDLY